MLTADPRPRPALSSGTTVGSYRIVAAIGAGATGEVYRARDLRLGREVALKLLPAGDPARRDLIEGEARGGRVKLLDFGIATSSQLSAPLEETMLPGTGSLVTGRIG